MTDLFVASSLLATARLGRLLFLAFVATSASSAEGGMEGKVNVLLRVEAHKERGHVHDLVADTKARSARSQGEDGLMNKEANERRYIVLIS